MHRIKRFLGEQGLFAGWLMTSTLADMEGRLSRIEENIKEIEKDLTPRPANPWITKLQSELLGTPEEIAFFTSKPQVSDNQFDKLELNLELLKLLKTNIDANRHKKAEGETKKRFEDLQGNYYAMISKMQKLVPPKACRQHF